MKRFNRSGIAFMSIATLTLLLFTSCRDKVIKKAEYTGNAPIYMSYEDLRNSIKTESPREIEHAGKIYLYGKYLLVNEQLKGIHVIDNSNPSNPRNISFINIPGNIDMAVNDNILYVDSYVDLVSLDISDVTNVTEIQRNEDVLAYKVPMPDQDYKIARIDDDQGVVIGYEVKEIKEKYEDDGSYYYYGCAFCDFSFANTENTVSISNSFGSDKSLAATGKGGSMAAMTLVNDHIYLIDQQSLKTFNKDNLEMTAKEDSWRILETMFPFEDKLFLGTTTGMIVYDLVNPSAPQFFSDFAHAESCDPVVADDNFAYVTLRSGTDCGGVNNELNIINIENLRNPYLVSRIDMSNPHGLGIDADKLFICDANAGLKIYDATTPELVGTGNTLIKSYPDINAMDVIPNNGVLIMIGSDGLYQYDYTDVNNISLLSHIAL